MIIDNAFDCIAQELTRWNCNHEWGRGRTTAFVVLGGTIGNKRFSYEGNPSKYTPQMEQIIVAELRNVLREVGAIEREPTPAKVSEPLTYMPDLFDGLNITEERPMTTEAPEAKEPRTNIRLSHTDVIKLMKLVTAHSTFDGEFLAYDAAWDDKRARQALIEQLGKNVDYLSFLRNRREIGWMKGEKEASNKRAGKIVVDDQSIEARVAVLEKRLKALELAANVARPSQQIGDIIRGSTLSNGNMASDFAAGASTRSPNGTSVL